MSLATLSTACQRIFESPFVGVQLEVAWHGGEPLTVPLTWYQEAVALMEERCPRHVSLKHRFQTNGLLLNPDWVRFLVQVGARIGVSIDGPQDIHDSRRRTRSGNGTHASAIRAVRLLQEQGVDFHVITVLTEQALHEPERLFEFYVRNGIKKVGFNIEEIEGAHSRSSLAHPDVEARYRQFMRRFLNLVWDNPELLQLRELEDTIGLLLSDPPARDEQNLPFMIVSVSHDGTISTFSPELMGARHRRFDGFGFGHVATHSLSDIQHEPLFTAISCEIRRGVAACERSCRYFPWCGGGAPANKLFETGRFDATETMHCRLTRQMMIDEVITGIEARIGQVQMRSPVSDLLN
jgi:uncharacterized protein